MNLLFIIKKKYLVMLMNKNLVFIGFMGCGKSTLGRKVSKCLGVQFVDTDRYIEHMEGMKISEIFATHSWV